MKVILSRRGLVAAILAAGSVLVQAKQSTTQEAPRSQTQPSAQQSEARTKISVNSELVVLPVTVKDRHGNLVPDLQKNDFRVFDDNVEQATEVFTAEAFPLSLVVLIDDDLKSQDAAQIAPTLRAITGGISLNDAESRCPFDSPIY